MQQLKMATYFEEILGDMLLKVENMKNNCQHCPNWNSMQWTIKIQNTSQNISVWEQKSLWVRSRSWKNEGFLALEPDEERGGNAVAKPAEEKGLAEAQAAEGWCGKNRNGAFPQGENIKIKSMSFWTTETITLTTMVRVLSKLTTQPKTPMLQLLRRSRTSQLVGESLNWFHHQKKAYMRIFVPKWAYFRTLLIWPIKEKNVGEMIIEHSTSEQMSKFC